MDRILHLDASARKSRSLSRDLSAHFVKEIKAARPEIDIIYRDVGANPPPFVSEAWIAAAFTGPGNRNSEQQAALEVSDELIAELESVDGIVMGTPMYNYGMPAALKAWFDQVIRVNRTFSFDLARGDWPLAPMLSGKKLVVLTARGEFGFEPGGIRSDWNHLETHIRTVSHYLGVEEMAVINIDYQEFGDERHRESVATALSDASRLARRWAEAVTEGAV